MGLYIYDNPIQARADGPITSGDSFPYAIHPAFFGELNPSPEGPAVSLVKVTLVAMAGGNEDNFFTGNGYFRIVWADNLDPVYQVSPVHWELLASGGTLAGLENGVVFDDPLPGGGEFTELGYKWTTTISNSVWGIDLEVFYQHSAYIQT
jgi:hypothetical protein